MKNMRMAVEEEIDVPVTGRGDKVEERVDPVVSEARVTLDTRLLGKDVVVLSLEVANDLGEAVGDKGSVNLEVITRRAGRWIDGLG